MNPLRALLLVVTGALGAQAPPPYKSLRADEDYRYLRDPDRATDFLDAVKYLPLDARDQAYLTFGGEVRERYEYFRNAQWGAGPQDPTGYLMQRYMLHADLHASEDVRVFAQLKSGFVTGRVGGPRPTDEDRLDLHQGFLDVAGKLAEDDTVTLRVGRQELQYGSSRLISVRESPNVRQTFDGARVILRAGEWRADAFAVRPVATEPGEFDDATDDTRDFFGVYATGPLSVLPDGHVDAYVLDLDRDVATYQQGSADESRWSFGTRLFGKPKPWDYDFEAVWQTGSFDGGRIDAWTVASDTGCTLPTVLSPRLSLKLDVASGDGDPETQGLQTFHALFPRGAYFGEPALIGPANLYDVHPALQVELAEAMHASVDWDWFWRQSKADGVYGSSLMPLRPGTTSDARAIGDQVEVGWEWAPQRHLSVNATYAHFFAGEWLRDTGAAEDIDYATVWVTFKF